MDTLSPAAAMAAFHRELVSFTEAEFREQRRAFQEMVSQPLEARLRGGKCVRGLRFDRRTQEGNQRFRCRENLSDFREGDRVVLHRGDPLTADFDMVWAGDGSLSRAEEFIDLRFVRPGQEGEIDGGGDYLLDLAFVDLERLVLRALDELAGSERGRGRILPLLMATAPEDQVDAAVYDQAERVAVREGFNDGQQEAIAEGVSTGWCCLIQGPPGTGKTRVLGQIVRQRVEAGQRVLVSAFTHRAIHEALNAVKRAMPAFDRIAKMGQIITDPNLTVPQYESFADSPFKDEAGAYVIGATPFAARGRRLAGVEFDCLVVDEASQMTLPLAVMAMLSAETYVIIGDPKQLPPVVQSISSWDAASVSVFHRLRMQRDRVLLDISYRMNRSIAAWVSEQFYDGVLQASESSAARVLALGGAGREQTWLTDVLEPKRSLVWMKTSALTTRHYSMEEAGCVMQIIEALLRGGHPAGEIGVVTPFRRQARTIRRRLWQSSNIEDDFVHEIVIDTVERMQGQERDVIIVSTAASDPGFISHLRDFLYLPARLNVAVSRARTKVIVMASDRLLQSSGLEPEIQEAVGLWRSLRAASYEVEL